MQSCSKLIWNPVHYLPLRTCLALEQAVGRHPDSHRLLFHTCAVRPRRKRDDGHTKNPQQPPGTFRGNLHQPQNNRDPLSVFKPVMVKPNPDDINFGEEIAGKINKQAMLRELNRFSGSPEVKTLSKEHGLDEYLYNQVRPAARFSGS
jgi:hypothetical protein